MAVLRPPWTVDRLVCTPCTSVEEYDYCCCVRGHRHHRRCPLLASSLLSGPSPISNPGAPNFPPFVCPKLASMAAFQLARSGFSPALRLSPPALRRPSGPLGPGRIRCRLPEDNGGEPDGSGWEEPPESLFMKELRRRGMTPTSLLEDGERGALGRGQRETEAKEDSGNGGGGRRRERGSRNGVASVELEKGMTRPRERFMSVNSEGFEGLLPRAKLLLTIGGTFFLGFWPLILVTAGVFAALHTCFGPSFVHDASKLAASPPPYIDPYSFLEDEKLPHAAN